MKKERDRIRNKIIKQEKNSENFAFKFQKSFQMTVVSFLYQITSNIMVKGKSSFSLCPWQIILQKQAKGNGIFFLPSKPQINTKHQGFKDLNELVHGRTHTLKQWLKLQKAPICEPLRWWMKFFSAKKHWRNISSLSLAMYRLSNFHKLGNQSFRALIEKGLYVWFTQMVVWERSRNSVLCVNKWNGEEDKRGNEEDNSWKQVSEGITMKFKIPPMKLLPVEVQSYQAQYRMGCSML